MSLTIAFFPHNQPHIDFFSTVADKLRSEKGVVPLFVKEVGKIKDQNVFEFEIELEKIWDDIDVTTEALESLQQRYPNFNFMRSLYSEREFNYYPYYYGDKPISREHQLKYMVGCFNVLERWIESVSIDFIISELIIGLADAVLKEVAEKRYVPYYSVRQSKMIPGIIVCTGYNDQPIGMQETYISFLKNGVPGDIKKKAIVHIKELREKIEHPAYMELTKKPLKVTPYQVVRSLTKSIIEIRKKPPATTITVKKHPKFNAYRSFLYRINNIFRMYLSFGRLFTKKIESDEKYIIYPLHYEPESSTTVRAFYFSDQLALIKLIAKVLPLEVKLVVKEHGGNKGYRKTDFYRELSYLPNVILLAPEYDVSKLIKNCVAVITLTGRMGWEAIVNNKPVITFGQSFWSSFDSVYNVQSWKELHDATRKCCGSVEQEDLYDNDKLIAFTSAYIKCLYRGNFVLNGSLFMTDDNVDAFCDLFLSLA